MTDPAVITFTTETGSVYRVDYAARTVERLTGDGPPTLRVGQGTRRFESVYPIEVGMRCVIHWGEHTEHKALGGAAPLTITSRVRSIA
jgi:hypothetical protein